FNPVLLGKHQDCLKLPIYKGWQTAVYTPVQLSRWPAGHNVGIRCGRQRNGRFLLVFDFDEEADRIFPAWQAEAVKIVDCDLVIVTSGRGYHVYFYVPDEMGSRTLAARRVEVNGRARLRKYIETIGRRKQIVSAGSRHPNGRQYQFYGAASYEDIPAINMKQLSDLTRLARRFDVRPILMPKPKPKFNTFIKTPANIQNCL
ncbi:MAG: bifunctional DNA primase/polymerase, partial [Aestuariibacter sp.]|nr:bifunctional DNA primase/polymerase [Aestuariibacter sp.]